MSTVSPATLVPRDSVDYLEILLEVFAEIVRRTTTGQENHAVGDITPSLVQCLQYIYLHGPSPIHRIATGMSMTLPGASQLVERLVQKRLVSRVHNPEDRRLARVELTDEGKAVVIEARSARSARLREVLDKMPAGQREALVNSLEKFIRLALESSGQVDEACARCGIDHLAFCVVNQAHVDSTGEPMEEF